MLPILLVLAVLLLLVVALILAVGRGSWGQGKLRTIRRIRTWRRQLLGPALDWLRDVMSNAWTRPARRGVAIQLRRLADRVERLGATAADLVRTRGELSRYMSQLRDISPVTTAPTRVPGERIRKTGTGRGWLIAALLAITGLAFAAANVWLLTEFVLPYLPEEFPVEGTMTAPVALSSLAFLLGLAYYTVGSLAGFGGRIFRWAAWLLIALLAAAEGYGVVTALQGAGMAALTWWGGIAVGTFLGGAGALMPAVIAATAHGAVERLDQWLSARDVRQARTSLAQQSETVDRLLQALDRIEGRVTAARAEIAALSTQGAGQLLLGGDQPTVERTVLILRRLARSVETDPEAPGRSDDGVVRTGLILLRDFAALAIWLLASAAALSLTIPSVAALTGPDSPILPAAMAAGIVLLLVMGAVLRWILTEVPLEKATPLRGALVLLTGLAAVAAGLAVGPAVSEAGVLETGVTEAGAWLALLVLVAAAASARLGNGVSALATLFSVLLAATAWLVLIAADLVLAGLDLLLTGRRTRGRRSTRGLDGDAAPEVGARESME